MSPVELFVAVAVTTFPPGGSTAGKVKEVLPFLLVFFWISPSKVLPSTYRNPR